MYRIRKFYKRYNHFRTQILGYETSIGSMLVMSLIRSSEKMRRSQIQTRLRKFIIQHRKISLPSLRMRCCVYGHVRVSNLLCKTHVHDCPYIYTNTECIKKVINSFKHCKYVQLLSDCKLFVGIYHLNVKCIIYSYFLHRFPE